MRSLHETLVLKCLYIHLRSIAPSVIYFKPYITSVLETSNQMAKEQRAHTGFAARFAARLKDATSGFSHSMDGLLGRCVAPKFKFGDHDTEYQVSLGPVGIPSQLSDLEAAKGSFGKNGKTGRKASFSSCFKGSFNKAFTRRSSSSSITFTSSIQSDRTARTSDSSMTSILSSVPSAQTDKGSKGSIFRRSSGTSSGRPSFFGSLGKLKLPSLEKSVADMNLSSPRSVYSMATTVTDTNHTNQGLRNTDTTAKMQTYFASYAVEGIEAVRARARAKATRKSRNASFNAKLIALRRANHAASARQFRNRKATTTQPRKANSGRKTAALHKKTKTKAA